MRICAVSFVGNSGVKHTAEVQGESLYEAAAEGIRAISEQWGEEPGASTSITVEVKPPAVEHQLTLKQIRSWLGTASPGPKDVVTKQRVRERLANLA